MFISTIYRSVWTLPRLYSGFPFGVGHQTWADNLRIWLEIIWHCWQNDRLFQNKWPKRLIHATYASDMWLNIFVDKLSQSANLGRIRYSLLQSENCKLSISNLIGWFPPQYPIGKFFSKNLSFPYPDMLNHAWFVLQPYFNQWNSLMHYVRGHFYETCHQRRNFDCPKTSRRLNQWDLESLSLPVPVRQILNLFWKEMVTSENLSVCQFQIS
jgi:hypothetical protein